MQKILKMLKEKLFACFMSQFIFLLLSEPYKNKRVGSWYLQGHDLVQDLWMKLPEPSSD